MAKTKSIKESNITNPTLKKNNKLIDSSNSSENFIKTSKSIVETKKEQLYSPNSIPEVKKKSINYNFYYYRSIEQEKKRNIIDTDA